MVAATCLGAPEAHTGSCAWGLPPPPSGSKQSTAKPRVLVIEVMYGGNDNVGGEMVVVEMAQKNGEGGAVGRAKRLRER